MAQVKRNHREPLTAQEDGNHVVVRYSSDNIALGHKDYRCEPTPVRVLVSKQETKNLAGNVSSVQHIRWTIAPHKSRLVNVGEIITLTNRQVIDEVVKAGFGEIVTPENTEKAEKLNKKKTENKSS